MEYQPPYGGGLVTEIQRDGWLLKTLGGEHELHDPTSRVCGVLASSRHANVFDVSCRVLHVDQVYRKRAREFK